MRDSNVGDPLEPWRASWSGGAEQSNELLWLLQVLGRRWKMIAVVAVLLTVGAALLLRQFTPLYAATTEILIDPQQAEYADLSAGPGARQSSVWPAEMETYVKIVWSDQLAGDLVEALGPAAFQEPPSPMKTVREWARPMVATLQSWLAAADPTDGTAASARLETPTERAVYVFHRFLKVERDSLAASLYITYSAPDPEFAARVANATAEAFPKELLRSQKAALAATADYLGERVKVLGSELEVAETRMRALQNKMSTFDGQSISEMRFRELIRAVSEAEAQVAVAKADVARMNLESDEQLGEAASGTLADLQRDRLQLDRRIAETASTIGERHPTMMALRAEQANLQASIDAEKARIRRLVEGTLEKSEARVGWLQQELADVETKLAHDMDDQVRLKQLITRTESTRQIYQDILARWQRASEQQLLLTPRARVINIAQAPARPEQRKQNLILALTACGSLSVGAGLALLLELRRRGFRSSDELAQVTGLPVLGSLPQVGRLSRPVYAEAARRLGLHLCPASKPGGASVVLVTSALPGDGKTVVSLSLARQLADSGQRVLLIDADLRKRRLQELLDLSVFPTLGLTALLSAPESKLESAIVRDTRSEADLILAMDPAKDPGRLLASPRMAGLLAKARTRYDAIVIDTPPVLAASEAMSLAARADRTLVVVRSETTPRKALLVALKELRAISDRPLGLVLNGVRLRRHGQYGDSDHLAYYRTCVQYLKS